MERSTTKVRKYISNSLAQKAKKNFHQPNKKFRKHLNRFFEKKKKEGGDEGKRGFSFLCLFDFALK